MGVVSEENVRPKGLGVRHAQTLLLFLAMLLAFTMRVNMSMAIVSMTDETKDQYFDWSHVQQSVVLSSFFWGYVILQIPAGELASRFGGKMLMATAISVNSGLSLLLPIGASYGGWQMVCGFRVLQGLTQAFVYPSMHHLVAQWIPLEEKGLLSTIIYAGGQLGIALQLIAAGFLATYWGWPSIFYVNGTLGAIWTALYLFFGSNSPEHSKIISQAELTYIQKSLGRSGAHKKFPTPWLKIMTSLPFWAVIVAHCGQNWGFFTLMTEMPTYMAKVLGVDLKSNGMLSSLPYLAMYALSFPMGAMTDLIIRKKWLSVSNTRKLSNSIGLWGPAIALIGLSYSPAGNMVIAVVMLTVAVGVNAGQYTGYMVNTMPCTPAGVQDMVNAEDEEHYDLSSLKTVYSVGDRLHPTLMKSFKQRYPHIKLLQFYSSTETGKITVQNPSNSESAVGVAAPGVTLKVVDVDTRAVLGPNQRGEICVRTPKMMKGYLGATSPYLDDQGFYLTGDLGYFDDQKQFYVVDRINYIIAYDGYKVSPMDVETVLLNHKAVREAAVVGKPAGALGELPAAFVVLRPGARATEAELADYVANEVSWYMQLRGGVRFVPELPRSPRQKVLRRRLREMLKLKVTRN